jgi:hypothetical protein
MRLDHEYTYTKLPIICQSSNWLFFWPTNMIYWMYAIGRLEHKPGV